MKHNAIIKKIGQKMIVIPQKLSFLCTDEMILNQTTWIAKMHKSYSFLKKIIPNYSLALYLFDVINRVKVMSKDQEKFDKIKKLWLETFICANEDEKMIIAHLFFVTGIFDDDICKTLMDYASKTSNQKYRYWLTMDISNITFAYGRGYYKDYYIERRNLLKQIAVEGDYEIPPVNEKGDNRTLCIVAYQLAPDMFNSMQRVAVMVAKAMNKYFDNVYVLTFDNFYVFGREKREINTISIWRKNLSVKNRNAINGLFGEDIKVKYVHENSYIQRNQEFLYSLYQCNPGVIVDISDDFSVMSYHYAKDFPTLCIPLRVGATSSFFTATEGVKWKIDILNEKYNYLNINDNNVFEWSFPEYVPPKTEPYIRKEIGIEDDKFIILTIAKCSNYCGKDFIDKMADLLNQCDKFVWLIVGDKAPQYMHEEYKELFQNDKVIERAFEQKLRSLCEICDVLLRTENTGGSGATAIAAMSGLPIVMLNRVCDPMRWLGKDYSNITCNTELFNHLVKLSEDSDLYEREKKRTIELVNKATNSDRIWKEFNDILESLMKAR